MFVICHLFPEIWDKVPENVSKRLNFSSVLGLSFAPSRKAPAEQDGETGRGLPALRHGERSGLQTHIAPTESVSIAAAHKGAAVVPHRCTVPIITKH
jgi:hypothetical protein